MHTPFRGDYTGRSGILHEKKRIFFKIKESGLYIRIDFIINELQNMLEMLDSNIGRLI